MMTEDQFITELDKTVQDFSDGEIKLQDAIHQLKLLGYSREESMSMLETACPDDEAFQTSSFDRQEAEEYDPKDQAACDRSNFQHGTTL